MRADTTKPRGVSEVPASHHDHTHMGLAGACLLLVLSLTTDEARTAQQDVQGAQFVPAQAVAAGSPSVASVSIESFQYTPQRLRVSPEATVLWTNRDGVDHDVTFREHDLKSPLVGRGGEIAVMFEKPGEYRYYCHVHPFMQGTVVVE